MKSKQAKIIVVVFLLAIFTISVISFVDNDKAISEKESRTLAQKPKLTLKGLFNGSFVSDFEEYYADQFPFRDLLLSLNFKVNTLLSIKTEDDVSLVEGGGGSHLDDNTDIFNPPPSNFPITTPTPEITPSETPEETPYVTEETPEGTENTPGVTEKTPTKAPTSTPVPKTPTPTPIPDDSSYEKDKQFLRVGDRILEIYWYDKKRANAYFDVMKRCADSLPGVNIYSILAPASVEYYTPDKYKGYGQSQKEAIEYVYSNMDSRIKRVDVYNVLKSHVNEYIYFRTDHHWTQRGAYYAYTEFCRVAGLTPDKLSSYKTGRINDFLGSYFKYVPEDRFKKNPDYVELFYPNANNTGTVYYDISMNPANSYGIKAVRSESEMIGQSLKYLAFINGDNPLSYFRTGVNNGKKILVFKDSYGNSFAPFLFSHYEEVYVIDARADKYLNNVLNFIKEKGINDVLFVNYINCPTQSDAFVLLGNML